MEIRADRTGRKAMSCWLDIALHDRAKESGMKWAKMIEFGLERGFLLEQVRARDKDLIEYREEAIRREENVGRLQGRLLILNEENQKLKEENESLRKMVRGKNETD